jgi:hypothetical protein
MWMLPIQSQANTPTTDQPGVVLGWQVGTPAIDLENAGITWKQKECYKRKNSPDGEF